MNQNNITSLTTLQLCFIVES